jgi:hypothetical protein
LTKGKYPICEPSAFVKVTCPESDQKGEKMMTIQKLKALVNTVIKQSTLDSSQITDLTQKFSLTAGDELEINDYKSAANNHWELELTTPVNEMAKWFAYIPHVEIKSNDPVAKILQDIKLSQFKVYHRPTEQDVEGVGIPPNGQDNRSERICPVYVLSPRRQTDSLCVGFHASTQPTFILYLIPPTYLLLLDFIEIGFWGFQKGSHRAFERGSFGEGKNWK